MAGGLEKTRPARVCLRTRVWYGAAAAKGVNGGTRLPPRTSTLAPAYTKPLRTRPAAATQVGNPSNATYAATRRNTAQHGAISRNRMPVGSSPTLYTPAPDIPAAHPPHCRRRPHLAPARRAVASSRGQAALYPHPYPRLGVTKQLGDKSMSTRTNW